MNARTPLRKYSGADAEIVDYGHQVLEGCSFAVRGPLNETRGTKTIACLGSAATFGRFVAKPFSALLADHLDQTVINLGFGGARFETFLLEPAIIELCRKSDVVILELTSARSYPSQIFTSKDHLGGRGELGPQYAKAVAKKHPKSKLVEPNLFVGKAFKWAGKNLPWEDLSAARQQMLDAYCLDAIRLIEAIGKPVVLLWFSQRSMDAHPAPGSYESWSRGFPHFVDRTIANRIAQHAIGLVDVTSKRGIPSTLTPIRAQNPDIAMPPGESPRTQGYYPSPEMHIDAAEKLGAFLEGWFDCTG